MVVRPDVPIHIKGANENDEKKNPVLAPIIPLERLIHDFVANYAM